MPWIIGGAVIGGGVLGAGASLLGASKQSKAAQEASRIQREQYAQTRKDLEPWRQGGQQSLQELMTRMGLGTNQTGSDANFGSLLKPFGMEDFQKSPAYQFNLEQGENAINKGASARGNYYAPQTLKDLGKFTQGTASNEFQNAYSNYNNNMNNIWQRLYGLSGTGQNAAAQTGGFGANAANQIGQNITGAGNAQAAGLVGASNAITGAGADAYNNYLMGQILGQSQRPNYGQVNIPSGM